MTKNIDLVIMGFGGHARSIADVALTIGFSSLLFIDENAQEDETFLDFRVLKELPNNIPDGCEYMPAAGDNSKRKKQIELIKLAQKPLATIISKNATIGVGSTLSAGCFIAHHTHVGPMTKIGEGCVVNTGAIIEHDCEIGDYTHVSVNSTVAGKSRLGKLVFLGVGATVIDTVSIADQVVVGAGALVVKSIDKPGTYVGVPAKLLNCMVA